LQETSQKTSEVFAKVLAELQQMAKQNNDRKLAALAGKISDVDDVYTDKPISRIDNVLVSQIAGEAIGVSGIDKVTYLKFDLQIAPDAAATMLSTNYTKAVRALTHLLDNAQKYTSAGTVTLRVAVDMMKMQAYYTVEDTGSGIEAADAERIFEPYVKLNQYFDGNGVGLTVARSIARRLGGDVVLDQGFAGPGSRFILTLPI
jgi:signal transduction histidine kinase